MSGQFLGSLIVSATSLALGIELYLKALRMKLEIPVRKTHHLLHLYDDLPVEVRTLIVNRYDQIRPSAIGKASGLRIPDRRFGERDAAPSGSGARPAAGAARRSDHLAPLLRRPGALFNGGGPGGLCGTHAAGDGGK